MSSTTGSPGEHEDVPRTGPSGRFADDLVGLDPADPEALAFAEHLDRVERQHPNYTVEGYLAGVDDFAASANRVGGHRRLVAVLLVGLILFGVVVAMWNALGEMLAILFG